MAYRILQYGVVSPDVSLILSASMLFAASQPSYLSK